MKKFASVWLALLFTGCASMSDQSTDSSEAKEYRTGSNLPVRDRSGSGNVKTVDVESIQELRNRVGARSLGTP